MNPVETQAEAALGGTSADAIERRSSVRAEPAWLVEQRLAAWERATSLPVPNSRTEGWRRTDLSGLDLLTVLEPVSGPSAAASAEGAKLGDLAGVVELTDAAVTRHSVSPELEHRGVLLMPLDRAVVERPDLLEQVLGEPTGGADSKFVSMAEALWENGVFLYVPRGVAIELPVLGRSVMASGSPCFFRTVVVAEEGADVTYVDDHISVERERDSLASGIVELHAHRAARIRYINLQQWNTRTWHFNRLRAQTARDARVDWLVVALGSGLHRAEVEASLRGQGSETEMIGLIFGTGSQHFDHQTLQDHIGNDSRSELNFKAALTDGSSSNYTGLIRVNKTALRTSSNLENRNLLLSDYSKAESDPRLEILNSDVVRCAHGATVGPLDPEMIFYIQSRGMRAEDAKRMVVEAFFEPILERIPIESLKADIWRNVQRKLGLAVAGDAVPQGTDEWLTG